MVTTKSPRARCSPAEIAAWWPALARSRTTRRFVPLAVQPLEDRGGQVGAAVVDRQHLVGRVDGLEDGAQPVDEEGEDVLLVVHGDDHGQHRMHALQVTAAVSGPLCVPCPAAMNVLIVLPGALLRWRDGAGRRGAGAVRQVGRTSPLADGPALPRLRPVRRVARLARRYADASARDDDEHGRGMRLSRPARGRLRRVLQRPRCGDRDLRRRDRHPTLGRRHGPSRGPGPRRHQGLGRHGARRRRR